MRDFKFIQKVLHIYQIMSILLVPFFKFERPSKVEEAE